MDLDLEELTLVELLEVETALVGFMLSALLLRCCHVIVEVYTCVWCVCVCVHACTKSLFWWYWTCIGKAINVRYYDTLCDVM